MIPALNDIFSLRFSAACTDREQLVDVLPPVHSQAATQSRAAACAHFVRVLKWSFVAAIIFRTL